MTLVYQSYRTHNVPDWISRCLESVKEWTAEKGYDYKFIDDEMFEYAPSWYREKVEDNVQLVSDLSRLILARRFLKEGYSRVIWMDADLLIFDPDNFVLETTEGAHFCREIWIDADPAGNIIHQEKINNSVSIFHQNNALLEFYTDACLKLVKEKERTPPVLVGTSFLTSLHKIYPFPEIRNVGIISPALVHDLLKNQNRHILKYVEWHGADIYAANLCGSKKEHVFGGVEINDRAMGTVVEKLIRGRSILSDSPRSIV